MIDDDLGEHNAGVSQVTTQAELGREQEVVGAYFSTRAKTRYF